jgi:hypothetical protein
MFYKLSPVAFILSPYLQQYYVEQYLIDAVLKEPKIDVRWLNKVVNIEQNTPNTEGG